ncbi:MAG: octaprenyl diphosphate synthase [Thiobacillaceae bacterium]|jgi:octaprenyl-diphosphate synthase|nr:octaprenyl diphosphate synthase [Thiobacillaceae bacterium]
MQSLLADDMAELDRVIRARLHSEVVLVRQVAEYIIHSGGKRLRPAVVMLVAKAFGYQGCHHHELAAVVEFIHTATLLHDDVVDDSKLRRGQDTANARFGNATSVLVGDFLYSRAFQMMVSVQNMRVMEVLSDATNVIAEGEVLQLMNCHDPEVTEEAYMRVIRYKTARLFDAAGRLGAIVSGQDRATEDALGAYGMHLGTAFQLIDDVLDYSGDKEATGKNVGDDLAEGKPTLPLLHVIRHGVPEQAERVRQAIANGGSEDFPAILQAIRDTGALEYTRRQAEREAQLAVDALASLPHGVYRDALIELPAFAVNRNY